jgi:hypothetical protein
VAFQKLSWRELFAGRLAQDQQLKTSAVWKNGITLAAKMDNDDEPWRSSIGVGTYAEAASGPTLAAKQREPVSGTPLPCLVKS